jgi:mannose-6-phosphate isomerase-like protein (cupin superfamily)
MQLSTAEATETGYDPTARRREVIAGPTHVDLIEVPPGGEIGDETHDDVDETLVVVAGQGEAELDGDRRPLRAGCVLFIPRGAPHNVRNTDGSPLRLYAVHADDA